MLQRLVGAFAENLVEKGVRVGTIAGIKQAASVSYGARDLQFSLDGSIDDGWNLEIGPALNQGVQPSRALESNFKSNIFQPYKKAVDR